MNKDKFIIYNHTPKVTDEKQLILLIYHVIANGEMSNNDTEYCYITTFKSGDVVSARKSKTGYRFDVYNEQELKRLKENENES